MFREDPPWSESNKNTEFYHCHEIKALKSIRDRIDSLVYTLNEQRTHYTLSAAIIPESLIDALGEVVNEIYDEQMTRDAAGRPTERSFRALEDKETEADDTDESDTDDGVSECDFCGEADTDDHECREHVPCCSR